MSFLDAPGVTAAGLDSAIQERIADPESAARGELNATYAGLPDNGGKPVGKGELMFNALDYEAVGDGVVDDRANIQAALDACGAAGGGVVYLPPGNYRIASGPELSIPNKVSVVGAGSGATTITQAYWGSPSLFKAEGAFGSVVNVTADVAINAATLTLASTTGMAKGDLLLLGSNEAVIGGVIPTDGYRGEYVRIKSVDSGTQVTIWGRTTTAYATASGAGVMPTKTFLSGVRVSGLTIVNTQPDQHDNGFLYFYQCLEVTVDDVIGRGCDSTAVQLMNVYGADVGNIHLYDQPDRVDVVPKRFGYGVALYAAAEQIRVHDSSFTRLRHGFTTSGYQNKWGVARNVTVSDCTASENTNASFDTHPGAVNVIFNGCVVSNTTSAAFQLRGLGSAVIGCSADNVATGVFITHNAIGAKVKASQFRNIGGWSTLGGTQTEFPPDSNGGGHGIELHGAVNVTITGNEFENLNRTGIYFDGLGSATVTRVYITNNKFVNMGRSGASRNGLYFASSITTLSDVYVANNLFGAHAAASTEPNSSGAIDDLFRIEVASASITKTYFHRNLIYGLGFAIVAGAGSASAGILERNNRIIDVAAELVNVGNLFMKGYIKFDEGQNLTFGTGTGTKIGTGATQKLAFFGANPVVQRAAYTQTYSTATRTHAARTATAVPTTAAALSSYGFTQAQADAIVTAINALIVDQANTAQIVNSLVNDQRNLGLTG